MTILDAHRYRPLEGGPSFPLTHRLFRLAWQLTWLILAAWTPPPMTAWRRAVLRAFGARLAAKTEVRSSARVWYPPNLTMDACSMIGPGAICYNMAPVRIGQRTVVSQRAHLCTGSHDVSDPFFQLVVRGITLEDDVWVAAEAFVGPGVTARQGAILGARAATFTDLAAWTIYRGNPAQAIRKRTRRSEPDAAMANTPEPWELFRPESPIAP